MQAALQGLLKSFDRHRCSALDDDLLRWVFGAEEGALPDRRSYARLLTVLAIRSTEGGHPVKSLTIRGETLDGEPLPLELPPRELLSRTRAARQRLTVVVRTCHGRIQGPEAFSDSLKAFHRTTVVPTGTQHGTLPAGVATTHVHQLDLTAMADAGDDLRRFPGSFGRDLLAMRDLRRIRAPEAWSKDEDFKDVCRHARADIEWVDPDGVGVGLTRGRALLPGFLRGCVSRPA